jgi:hypothetical protein
MLNFMTRTIFGDKYRSLSSSLCKLYIAECQHNATFLIYLFLHTLYIFQVVPPPIIRST